MLTEPYFWVGVVLGVVLHYIFTQGTGTARA